MEGEIEGVGVGGDVAEELSGCLQYDGAGGMLWGYLRDIWGGAGCSLCDEVGESIAFGVDAIPKHGVIGERVEGGNGAERR